MSSDANTLIDLALAAGDVAEAVALSRQAFAAGDADPFVCNLVAWQLVEDGDPEGAEALLRVGLAGAPDDPGLLSTLGLALRRQHRLSAALQAVDAAIAIAPDYPIAWLERAFALHQGNSLGLAEANYRHVAELDPGQVAAFAGVAAIAATRGDAAIAREFADRALALDAGNAVAHCALARCDIAAGQAVLALDRLEAVLATSGLNLDNRSAALSLLGDARLQTGDAAGAHTAYIDAKSMLPARFPRLAAAEPLLDMVNRIGRAVVSGTASWTAPGPTEPSRGHAFLLGYPRSGTTLVENILASVDGVDAVEELPTLLAAETAFWLPDDGPEQLARLDAATARHLRAAYWQRVADFGVDPSTRLFVDMDPLKTMDLPIIGRLFPAAAIIVMRRDPRDVVLSCFRQNFAASPIAFEFTSLDRAARHYAALMQLQVDSLQRLGNPVHVLRYEALVADFDAVTRRLCDFLGLTWSESLREFSATARSRNVNTASVGQVRRGLYDGSGQWRRFKAQLAPVMPILDPWLSAFGYAL